MRHWSFVSSTSGERSDCHSNKKAYSGVVTTSLPPQILRRLTLKSSWHPAPPPCARIAEVRLQVVATRKTNLEWRQEMKKEGPNPECLVLWKEHLFLKGTWEPSAAHGSDRPTVGKGSQGVCSALGGSSS